MTSPSYYTNAGNFISAVQSGVDPRTGLFNIHLPLANTHANALMGPMLSLALSYSPLSRVDDGFGTGFRLNLSRYDLNTGQLLLSTGEEYRVGSNGKVKQQKLKNFIFKKLDDSNYRIIYKSGLVEHLTLKRGDVYVPTQILSADGRALNLDWTSQFLPARLTAITDDNGCVLCSVKYPDDEFATTRFTLLPRNAEITHSFTFTNELLVKLVSRTAGDALTWSFDYTDIGPSESYRAITGVKAPTGLEEKVEYYTDEDSMMAFPDIAGLPPLPCVYRHRLIPGGGQPKSTTIWGYTQANYLGKNAPLNEWHSDQDQMLHILLPDYQYASTEQRLDAAGNIAYKINRSYNSYHLLVSESTERDGKTCVRETDYHAQSNKTLDEQPAQYALPKAQLETWSASNKANQSRTQITKWEFDEEGNPLRQEAPDGTVIEYTYYPAAGEGDDCPADPYGFTRYLKMQIVTPPKRSGDELTSTICNKWQKLPALTGDGYCVVQQIVEQTTGSRRTVTVNSYSNDCSHPHLHGRLLYQNVVITPDINKSDTFSNKQDFAYFIKSGSVTEKCTFTGFDELQTIHCTIRHPLTGLVLSEISAQGVKTSYSYDARGRVTSCILCPGTAYENTTSWQYSVEETGLSSIETGASGNQNKTVYDGAGRIISQARFDADSSSWYDIFSCGYDSLGQTVTGTVSDWLPAGTDNFSLQSNIAYDGWGEKAAVVFSDGRKTQQQTDLVNLTQTVSSQGGTAGRQILSSGSITTLLDKTSKLLISEEKKDATGQPAGTKNYVWDGLGRLREKQDELGTVIKMTYDACSRVETQTLPDGTVVSRTYAPHLQGGQIASISVTGPDAKGNTHTWQLGQQTFDSLGRLTKSVSGGRTTCYAYQGASPVPSAVTLPSGKTVTYSYIPELGNAISTITAENLTQTFSYDKKTGRLLTESEAGMQTVNSWIPAGLLSQEEFTRNGRSCQAHYTHTLNGAPATYTDVTGKTIEYIMDTAGRLTHITDDCLTVDMAYDGLGRLSTQTVSDASSPSTVTTALEYDSFGREITRIIQEKGGIKLVLSQTWLENNLLSARILQKNGIQIRKENYIYDSRNRLTGYKVSGSSRPQDPYGHQMIGQTYSYNALNNLTCVKTALFGGKRDTAIYHYENSKDPTQLTAITHTYAGYPKRISLSYDAQGCLICDEAGRTLSYDVLGRLSGVSGKNGSGCTYSYDALNRLVTQNIGSQDSRDLYYRGTELVTEITASPPHEIRLIKNGHSCLGVSDNGKLKPLAADKNDSPLWSASAGITELSSNKI